MNDPVPGALELDEKNAMALAIVPVGKFSLEIYDIKHYVKVKTSIPEISLGSQGQSNNIKFGGLVLSNVGKVNIIEFKLQNIKNLIKK